MLHQTSARVAHILGMLSLTVLAPQAMFAASHSAQTRVSLQPFAQQVRQVETSLAYLGQPLAQADQDAINRAIANADESSAITQLESILDKYTLAVVEINPESRVKVQAGSANPELVEAGTRILLVKDLNKAGVTPRLQAQSHNAPPVFVPSDSRAEPPQQGSPADVRDRWVGFE